MKIQLTFLCVFILIFQTAVKAEKTVEFNGKKYLVYPQIIENGYIINVTFDYRKLSLKTNLPPVIGNLPDGEYVIYTDEYYLKNKRKTHFETIYDTFYYVYASFTIKNNKKEGLATIYKQYEKPVIDIQIPYVNDLIHGKVVLYNKNMYDEWGYSRSDLELSTEELFPSPNTIFTRNRYKQLNYKGFKFVLNYEKGMVNGVFEKYYFTRRDTLLCDQFYVVNNQRTGLYKHFVYCIKRKHIDKYMFKSGYMVNDLKVGVWEEIDYDLKTRSVNHYNDSGRSAYLFYSDSFNLVSKILYGKDSVLKYVPDYKNRVLFPNVPVFNYKGSSKEVIKFIYESDKLIDTMFLIDGFTSVGFYDYTGTFSSVKDTIIGGRYYRTKTRNKVTEFFEIDTCSLTKFNSQIYCAKLLWSNIYNKNEKIIRHTYSDYFRNKYLLNNTIIYEESTQKQKYFTRLTFYYKPLKFKFSNIEFHNNFNMNACMYYKVSGDSVTGSIIKYIKIPLEADTLVLIDTLMQKGKIFNDYDDYFLCGIGNTTAHKYIDLDDEWQYPSILLKNNIATALDEYFIVKPVHHKAIYLSNIPFTGNLDVFKSYGNKINSLKVKLLEEKFYSNGEVKQSLILNFEIIKPNYASRSKTNFQYNLKPLIKSLKLHVTDGNFNGMFRALNIFDNLFSNGYYYKNKLNDDFGWQLYAVQDYKTYKKIKKKKVIPIEKSRMHYNNGKKEGQWNLTKYSYYDMETYYLTFHKNKLEGNQYKTIKNTNGVYINCVAPMLNDTINGQLWILQENGYPSYSGNFKMGIPNGEFIKYFELDTFKFYKEKYRFENGFLSGRYEKYRDSNNLKFTIDYQKSDGFYFSVYEPVAIKRERYNTTHNASKELYEKFVPKVNTYSTLNLSGYNFIRDLFINPYIGKGFYTYYYKSGTIFKLGLMEDYLPKGTWKFYREGKDRLYKTIDFKDSVVKLSLYDSIETFGIVHAYYDDGRLMFKGYATDISSKYSCDSEADIPTEENYYLEFYDTAGNSALKEGNGFICELQASGHKLKEGQIQNSKKQGIWVYYNSFGQPEAIGFFNNGKKHGRWLVGDLSGLNLSDKVCFMSNEEFLMWVDTYGKNLSLSEEFYNNGVLVSDNTVNTISR